jgi:hypothetical protein
MDTFALPILSLVALGSTLALSMLSILEARQRRAREVRVTRRRRPQR